MFPQILGCAPDPTKPKRRNTAGKRNRSLGYLARWHTKRAPGKVSAELVDHLIDFQDHRCWYCQTHLNRAMGSRRNWCLEHKTPISRGGTNEASNLVIACRLCNKLKNTMTAEEFLACTNRPGAEAASHARGTVDTHGSASMRGTPEDAGNSSGILAGTREETSTTSHVASIVNSRRDSSKNAMPLHARVETKVLHGDASGGHSLDAAYRQSLPLEQSRVGRSGAVAEA